MKQRVCSVCSITYNTSHICCKITNFEISTVPFSLNGVFAKIVLLNPTMILSDVMSLYLDTYGMMPIDSLLEVGLGSLLFAWYGLIQPQCHGIMSLPFFYHIL